MNDFDEFAADYSGCLDRSLRIIGQKHETFIDVKARLLIDLVARRIGDVRNQHLLDVGCGIGLIAQRLTGHVKSYSGIDVSRTSIKNAQHRVPAAAFIHYDGSHIPFEDGVFSLVFAACVAHHIPMGERLNFFVEMARVVKPNGLVVVLEHNPFNPFTRLIVGRCELDTDAILLTAASSRQLLIDCGLKPIEQRYFTFFPFNIGLMTKMEGRLGWLPFGAQYYVAAGR